MPALIVVNQSTRPAGTPGRARSDGVTSQLVTCTNSTVESTYLWTLVDVPIRSALTRGTTGTAASFGFTPDVKGTYIVSLRVNGSVAGADNDSTYLAIRSFAAETLGWRYQGAGETTEDNETFAGLGFPSDVNPRGWATNEDVIFEAIENGIWQVQNGIGSFSGVVERLVYTDPATGKVHPSLIAGSTPTGPASGDLSGTFPGPTVVGLYGRPISSTPPTPSQQLVWDGSAWTPTTFTGGITGPGSSTDNAMVRWDGVGGNVIQNGIAIETDAGELLAGDGTITNPAHSFVSEPGLGTRRAGAAQLAVTITGSDRWIFSTTALTATAAGNILTNNAANGNLLVSANMSTGSTPGLTLTNNTALTAGVGVLQVGTKLDYTLNQTSTAGFTAIDLAITETAVGSGAQYLINAKTGVAGSTQVFSVTRAGAVKVPAGVVSAVAYGLGVSNTGLYSIGTSFLNFAFAGSETFRFSDAGGFRAFGTFPQWDAASTNGHLGLYGSIVATTPAAILLSNNNPFSAGAGISQLGTQIAFVINQSSTAAFTALDFAITETAVGSGAQYLINAKTGVGGATQVFAVGRDGRVYAASGGAGTPTFSFVSDTDTGMYSIGANNVGFATNGVLRFDISTTAITSTLPLSMSSQKITNMANGVAVTDGATVGQLNTFPTPITDSTNARTLTDADNGCLILCTRNGGITITVPDTLTAGFSCQVAPSGTGSGVVFAVSGTQVLKKTTAVDAAVSIAEGVAGVIIFSATRAQLVGNLDPAGTAFVVV